MRRDNTGSRHQTPSAFQFSLAGVADSFVKMVELELGHFFFFLIFGLGSTEWGKDNNLKKQAQRQDREFIAHIEEYKESILQEQRAVKNKVRPE